MIVRRSLLVGIMLTVGIGALLALSPLGSITADAFDKVSVTRSSDDNATEAAGTKLNVSGATGDDIDRSLVGVATLGAVFLGFGVLLAGVVAISLRF